MTRPSVWKSHPYAAVTLCMAWSAMIAHFALGWLARGSYIWGGPHAVGPIIDRATQPFGFWSGVISTLAIAGSVFGFSVYNVVRHLRRGSRAV